MSVQIGFDLEKMKPVVSSPIFYKELDMNDEEAQAFSIFQSLLSEKVDVSKLILERRSYSYISVIYNEHDVIRFKFTSRTKWISIRLTESDRKTNVDNPLFAEQKNKNQLHWKAKLHDLEDIGKFKDFIISACIQF